MANWLTYSISRELLKGSVDNHTFSLQAYSGGGRGRLGKGAAHDLGSYDVFRKEDDSGGVHQHGGPLPPGQYICRHLATHKTYGECIFLEQTLSSLVHIDAPFNIRLYNRDGFFIHGRGTHGSEGCIVPRDPDQRKALNAAIKNASSQVVLEVVEPGMPKPRTRVGPRRASRV